MVKYHRERLHDLVEHYMDCRRLNPSPVSLAAASKAITTVMPDCPLAGRELANLIAASAIRHGHIVSFDLDRTLHRSAAGH